MMIAEDIIKLDSEGIKYSCDCEAVRLKHGGWFRTKKKLTLCPYCNREIKRL